MKVAALVGSIRKDSYNMKLTNFIQERYKDCLNITIVPIRDLAHYDQDIEHEVPNSVQRFKDELSDADAFLIVTPEFNHSIPGVLKNALDWLSRGKREMAGKPTFIAGASMGILGTVRAQMQLRQILNAPGMGANVLPGNEILIGSVQHKVNDHGLLNDQSTIEFIDGVIDQFMLFAEAELVKP
ncbi:NAD(P)H-dependent oxidoreductase [Halobacillus shinanisalinarum]|uniref:NAD(P)H-dependent oxidoreductase n=1 Tax=Halobacillus shinanisalinarum TaxID=2932258 RepID=A0ABY4H5F0_9BACI|nr:NADPH-dependent FMN reductase [Halobacillus shinanisalinarum]UOQ95697.1 NAD(P)H-dependent oxidoreductase [Halobacillus shinanisalinarum]